MQLRSRIGCGADIGAERCGIVDDQFAGAVQEVDLRGRAGGRGNFERGAAAELEQAGAACINSRRHVERAGDADRAVVQDGWGIFAPLSVQLAPASTARTWKLLNEPVPTPPIEPVPLASSSVLVPLPPVTLPTNTAPGSTTSRLVPLPAKSMA